MMQSVLLLKLKCVHGSAEQHTNRTSLKKKTKQTREREKCLTEKVAIQVQQGLIFVLVFIKHYDSGDG